MQVPESIREENVATECRLTSKLARIGPNPNLSLIFIIMRRAKITLHAMSQFKLN